MTSGLAMAWIALVVVQAAAWAGAGTIAARPAALTRPPLALAVAGLAVAGLGGALGAVAVALAMASAHWTFAAEKLTVAAPIGVLSSALALAITVRQLFAVRRTGAESRPALLASLISAALAAVLGLLSMFLIGPAVTWPAVLGVVLLWAAGSVVAFALVAGARRPVVASGAAFGVLSLSILLIVTVFGPVGAAAASGHHLATAPSDGATTSVDELREPAEGDPDVAIELEARQHEVGLADGTTYDAVTFGSLPGPALVVTEGELVQVTLTNLDVASGVTLHWHGLDVPNGEDGVAGVTQDAVRPGDSFVYRFVPHQAGTFWYHTHQDALQGIRRGLYGSIVVLPADGIGAEVDATALLHTISGDLLVGAEPVLHVPAEDGDDVRLRLGNTDQVPHRIVLDADAEIVALDGTDLDSPAALTAGTVLSIPAGGRADLALVAAGTATLRVQGEAGSAITIGAGGEPAQLGFGGPAFDLLDAASGAMPAWLDEGAGVRAEQVLDRLIRVTGGVPRLADTINGGVFPTIDPIVVDEGDVVEVTVVNRSTVVHPMHLHGHRMVVLSRDGVPADGALVLDTVDVAPGEVWRIAFVADNPGIWMDHCHNLEHAAVGMVMHLAYRGVESPYELEGEHGNAPE